jgi:hypothetical protein
MHPTTRIPQWIEIRQALHARTTDQNSTCPQHKPKEHNMRIFLAAGWQNSVEQPEVLRRLRQEGHDVFDVFEPAAIGFRSGYANHVDYHDVRTVSLGGNDSYCFEQAPDAGYAHDYAELLSADTCVLMATTDTTPTMYAGMCFATDKPLIILAKQMPPSDFLRHAASAICLTVESLIAYLRKAPLERIERQIRQTEKLVKLPRLSK